MRLKTVKSIELFEHVVNEEEKKFKEHEQQYGWVYEKIDGSHGDYLKYHIINGHFVVSLTFHKKDLWCDWEHRAVSELQRLVQVAEVMQHEENELFEQNLKQEIDSL